MQSLLSILPILLTLAGSAAARGLPAQALPVGDIPHLAIEMKGKTLRKLERSRQELFRQDVPDPNAETEFSASLVLERGDPTRERGPWRAKLSLVTQLPEKPARAEGWPLRVELKADKPLLGMTGFTLRPEETERFLAEALVRDQLRREGVLVARTWFVRVSLRGRDMGLMRLEEAYGKELLESQQRREGVILAFEAPRRTLGEPTLETSDVERGFYRVRLLPFRAASIAENEPLYAELATAAGLVRGFIQGLSPAREVFDLHAMGGFLAVAELWDASRALEWPNLRFYLNPLTQRLEPIASEVRPDLRDPGPKLTTQGSAWASLLLADPELHSAFQRRLQSLAAGMAGGGEASRLARVRASLLRLLRSGDTSEAALLDLRFVSNRAARLAELAQQTEGGTRPKEAEPPPIAPSALPAPAGAPPAPEADPGTALRVYRVTERGRDYLEFANLLPTPVKLLSVELTGLDPWQKTDDALRGPSRLPVALPPPAPSGRLQFVRLLFRAPRVAPSDYGVKAAIAVEGRRRRGAIEVLPYFPALHSNPIPAADLSQTLALHPFLAWDEGGRTLRARAGTWKLSSSLILPPGVGLELGPATTLQFPDDGLLLASGPLHFRGTEQQPVVLEGQSGRAGAGRWRGIVVLESDRPHSWKHVIVRNTMGTQQDGWPLTGGVTIRASEVQIADTLFQRHRGEDALNLIRADFEMHEVSVLDASSDAFDCDFCSGRITGGRFAHVGGDAIDVSGSEVLVEGVVFEDIRDKALSVGERSRLTARGVEVRGAGVALASKDDSVARLEDSSVTRVAHAALMAYTKKPEYGPAQITALRVRVQEVGRTAVAQTGSRISIDGVEQEPEDVDIDALYRHGFMKK